MSTPEKLTLDRAFKDYQRLLYAAGRAYNYFVNGEDCNDEPEAIMHALRVALTASGEDLGWKLEDALAEQEKYLATTDDPDYYRSLAEKGDA